ncbi:MAG: hypothetical protein M1816_006828 [Peltula sp. TS41687]|nr:MAG: hypothetical protein M1816_006828 [Peltula sp. TS41687]
MSISADSASMQQQQRAMSREPWSPENYISHLSHQPREIYNGMISISKPAKPSTIQRDSASSTIGLLERLPLELVHATLNLLDFQSLSRLSRVSLRGEAVVSSLPAYRDLMEHAPHALTALGQTRLINVHSSAALRAALKSDQCVSCREYGAFLFLPTCERCCFVCLQRNQSLWVIPTALAGKCFRLTPKQLKSIPILYSIPGVYWIGRRISQRRKLLSVKMAKELGIVVHGSIEKMVSLPLAIRRSASAEIRLREFHTFKWLQDAPLEPLGWSPFTLPDKGNTPNDNFVGMASVPFPSFLPGLAAEKGIWCRGCEWTFEQYQRQRLASGVVSASVPRGCDPSRVLLAMQRRARSRSGFLEHIAHCHGARELILEIERKGIKQE